MQTDCERDDVFLNMDTARREGGARRASRARTSTKFNAHVFLVRDPPPKAPTVWCHYPHIHVSHAEPWQISGGAVDHAFGTRLTAADWMILASKQG